ncbi:LysR family transcriptional regulator [Arthrobacter sp. AQ5-05]|uniref:LysR family transcriptional regulator n=1 Tax=Arthrobacter sp. AQ5-05 TaxID=2184581 RepID=UPI000DCAECFA|nr:LysR family transcriptional regulator [Arthrobacter sp. AQ5-05]RAX48545.1 LysR family transcriptional regulator [Arthrobacter sp. AQ5-05]
MSLDLNLLRTFLEIYAAKSVTRAAEELSLTQPTVSHSLARLRTQLGDPLFVRGPRGLVPTNRAHELFQVFRSSVDAIDGAIDSSAAFDPSTTVRTFRICLSDIGEVIFLPSIMRHFGTLAPHASLESVPMNVERIPHWLAHGQVDAALTSLVLGGGARREGVIKDRYVCLLPRSMAPKQAKLSDKQFDALNFVTIDPTAGHGQIEERLADSGIRLRTALRVHHFSALPSVLLEGSLAAVVPLEIAERFCRHWPLEHRELPVDSPAFSVDVYTDHKIAASGPALWFRELVRESLRDMPSALGPATD